MESVDLEMGDIFDGGEDADDLDLPPPLPDLDTEDVLAERAGDEADEASEAPQTRDMSKGAAKKRVMRPQPKLNAERLKADRGLPQLPSLFEKTKFKGKGHETEDLKLMMTQLEHWAHRLFPKIPFDDFIARLEKLGQTKPVQTCLKRIRLDMSVGDEDLVVHDNVDDEDAANENNANNDSSVNQQDEPLVNADDAYEEMLRQEREQQQQAPSGDADVNTVASAEDTTVTKPTSLTNEQLERIQRNREMALQKRRLHTAAQQSSAIKTPSQSTEANDACTTNPPTETSDEQQTQDEILASLDSEDDDDVQVAPPAENDPQPTQDTPARTETEEES